MPENSVHQQFKLKDFEGPLDLLLFLIKKNEVNIYDIPIADITEQYLAYLQYATKADLDSLTEFYLMASTLLYIKSRMLLPVEINLEDEIDDPRQELVEKLIEYQKFRKLSELIESSEPEWSIEREKSQRGLPFEEEEVWEEINVWDLLKTFSAIIASISAEKIIDLYEEVSVNEKITLMNELLDEQAEISFVDLVRRKDSVMEIVCSFLAVLEMAKLKRIVLLQNKFFGEIRIRGRETDGS